jgi:clan AA aspartic protease (TIGR02281 family)
MSRYALALLVASITAAAAEPPPMCESERYYHPKDYTQAVPLAQPHAEFARTLTLAGAGKAAQQRSLGIAYESGYMVDACEARARYWFARAAAAGDEEAKRWMARARLLAKMRISPECAAQSCPSYADGPQLVELYAGTNGHYVTSMTINGVSVQAMVDTGASSVALGSETAKRMGIAYETGRAVTMQTANGTRSGRIVVLPVVQVGSIVLNDVLATVSDGEMPVLLGMSFLGRLNVSIRQGSMSLSRPEGGVPVAVEPATPPAPASAEED